LTKVVKPVVKVSKKPSKKLSDDESDGGYDSGNSSSSDLHQIETRKRVLKLKEKKKVAFKSRPPTSGPSAKVKPIKSKFLELEADVGSASD
jgi:hypothetical protein